LAGRLRRVFNWSIASRKRDEIYCKIQKHITLLARRKARSPIVARKKLQSDEYVGLIAVSVAVTMTVCFVVWCSQAALIAFA